MHETSTERGSASAPDALAGLLEEATRWADHDPDPRTAEALRRTIAAASADATDDTPDLPGAASHEDAPTTPDGAAPDAAAPQSPDAALTTTASQAELAQAELRAAFAGPLAFGTAGLRGAVGPGESRMNTAVVTRATAGLMAWLTETAGPAPRVVVGCDARHGSHDFYEAALEVVSAAGGQALALPEQLPTPVTAYAVRALEADAGIMITASHNPPADNGYKVYLGGRAATGDGDGVQIVPPADAQISAHIAAAPPADQVPRDRENLAQVPACLVEDYVRHAAALAEPRERTTARIVLTPMHGVGGATARRVLDLAGFRHVDVVPEQADPDPDFPTVGFPNPEEPGALDLALKLAERERADIVVALDPDADRCSVAIPQEGGTWRQLTGDEIGAVLGQQAAQDSRRSGTVLANSVVSSRLLGRIAQAHGLEWRQTLTGFKWIARTPGLRFGYEEAIGYCTDPSTVRDKDGITAMVRVADLVQRLKDQGRTVQDVLDDVAREHGLYATRQVSFRVQERTLIQDGMVALRSRPPRTLGGSPVVTAQDLAEGGELPPTDALLYLTEDGSRVIVRPSGTEPKLKCYLEAVVPVPRGAEIPRATAAERLDRLAADITDALGF